MSDLIIVRGAPAVGKSSVCKQLREILIQKQKRVSLVHWDDILYLVQPVGNLDDHAVLSVTKNMILIVKSLIASRVCDVVIMDGVFLLMKEHEMIKELSAHFSTVTSVRLYCPLEVHLQRNATRPSEDFLEEERVKYLVTHHLWKDPLLDEIEIDTTKYSPQHVCHYIIEHQGSSQKELGATLSFLDPVWSFGDILRYPTASVAKVNDVPFYKLDDHNFHMLQHFAFPYSDQLAISLIESVTKNKYAFHFHYMNENCMGLNRMIETVLDHGIVLREKCVWEAPVFVKDLTDNVEILFDGVTKRLKRTMKKMDEHRSQLYHKTNDFDNPHILWKDCLSIDGQSWKYQEQSHMQGLEREDLKYVLPVINHQNRCSLFITYHNDGTPLAYSMVACAADTTKWYAIKWGATDQSRELFSGIHCLLEHIKYLFVRTQRQNKSGQFTIDFWGRNQPVYDQLKTHTVTRKHLVLQEEI